jgi:Helix-turn-helix domain
MPRKLARKSASQTRPRVTDIEVGEEDEKEKPEEWRPTPLLYNVADACFILGKISKQMLYRLIGLHEITPVKIGTRSLFTMPELQRFVDTREQEASQAAAS